MPHHVVSWWTKIDDLTWPEQRVRDKIQRRADSIAAARVDTVINIGFHYRFDFCWYFGALHGLLADIAEALHERCIRFLDHFSCTAIARPRTRADILNFFATQRHVVPLYPDALAAPQAGYAGYRFNDLREVDVETGAPVYHDGYAAEWLCHNNSDYQQMHRTYLQRLFADVPLDGLMQDDMIFYGGFRTCGCRYCRERFRREYGHELPPLADTAFWGDTSGAPATWGNYENPAFRDWVHLRYQSTADHLKMVRQTIGPDKVLLTCCSDSGPMDLNSCGLSYESFIPYCDWVMMENCGLSTRTVRWWEKEPEVMLHKAVAAGKAPPGAPCLALSYFIYPDGAYLGWAVARFWGVSNWASTLLGRLPADPPDAVSEDAELVHPFNRWEDENCAPEPGAVVSEVQLAFLRAARDNGWRDAQGRDHWSRVRQWCEILIQADIGYRFVVGIDIDSAVGRLDSGQALVLDGCAHLSERQCASLKEYLRRGSRVWIIPPLGTHDERGQVRPHALLEELEADSGMRGAIQVFDPAQGPQIMPHLIEGGHLRPRIRRVSGTSDWSLRLHRHGNRWALHLLNRCLKGEAAQFPGNAWNRDILRWIHAPSCHEPLVVELDLTGLPELKNPMLLSPELNAARPIGLEQTTPTHVRLTLDLETIRAYAMVGQPQPAPSLGNLQTAPN